MKRTMSIALVAGCLMLVFSGLLVSARAAAPSAEQALKLMPIQKGVDIDRPNAQVAAKCTIAARKLDGHVGWIVESPEGVVLRKFVDTNGDNVVDQWSYYKGGLEVYRDIDANFNGKADQYRWFHTAGSRWALDKDEDGRIDAWKAISAEEVTAEVIAALAHGDVERFARLTLTPSELESLGIGPEKARQLADRIGKLRTGFEQLAARQKGVTDKTRWVQFSGNRPGTVPTGTDGSTKDLRVYENVVAIVQTGTEHGEVQIGTLVEVGNVWRVIDVPRPLSDAQTELVATGFFFRGSMADRSPPAMIGSNEKTQALLADLEKLDAAAAGARSAEEQARFNAQRADVLEQIAQQAERPEERAMWLRQLADMVSAAVQSGTYPEGAERLEALFKRLQGRAGDKHLAAYVKFRQLTADYGLSIQNASPSDFVKLQEQWLKQLEQYASDYPDSPDTAEAILQLAIAQEFAGEEDEAKKWYARVVAEFPNSQQARKAAGARTRLESVGKSISLQGKTPEGDVVDLANYRGKVVLIQYWASWSERCKADMATLKELAAKYGRSGFSIIGVNLDSSLEQMANYLAENRLPWPQIFEEGGLDSRPANELGVLTLPTMILIDQQGRVVDRNVQVAELDGALKKLVR